MLSTAMEIDKTLVHKTQDTVFKVLMVDKEVAR